MKECIVCKNCSSHMLITTKNVTATCLACNERFSITKAEWLEIAVYEKKMNLFRMNKILSPSEESFLEKEENKKIRTLFKWSKKCDWDIWLSKKFKNIFNKEK